MASWERGRSDWHASLPAIRSRSGKRKFAKAVAGAGDAVILDLENGAAPDWDAAVPLNG